MFMCIWGHAWGVSAQLVLQHRHCLYDLRQLNAGGNVMCNTMIILSIVVGDKTRTCTCITAMGCKAVHCTCNSRCRCVL